MLPINEVICGDVRDVLPTLPDNYFDLVVTDPPYGIGVDYGEYSDSEENLQVLMDSVFPEMLRVSKLLVITCGVNNIHKYPKPTWILCWYSKAGAGMCSWGFSCWQPILVYGKDPYLKNRLGARSDILGHTESSLKCNHPCPKPLRLMEKIILRVSVDKNDIILDPFAGSGSTLVAAKNLGRRYVGIEIEPKYVAICNERLSQQTLNFEVK